MKNRELDAALLRLADIRRRLANLRTDQANVHLKREYPMEPVRRELHE